MRLPYNWQPARVFFPLSFSGSSETCDLGLAGANSAPDNSARMGERNDANVDLLGQVRSLAQNLIFKIWRELIVRHASSILRMRGAQKNVSAAKKDCKGAMFKLRCLTTSHDSERAYKWRVGARRYSVQG